MKRLLTVLALGVSFVLTTAGRGDDVPHLEFARGLREKNYPDLALEYLEELSKKPNLSKELREALPLEIARTQVDVAAKDPDPAARARVYEAARQRMQTYLKNAPAGTPDAVIANLDLARIQSLQAKAVLERAKQAESQAAADNGRADARKQFQDAYAAITIAYDGINGLLVKGRTPVLTQAKLDAEYERAVTSMYWLFTFSDRDDAAERAKIGLQAVAELKLVADRSDRTGWMALANLVRCYDELDSFDDAEKVMKQFNASALEPGKRMAEAYYFQLAARKDLQGNKRLVPLGQKWIKEYRGYVDTPEGIAVRYQVAQAARIQSRAIKPPTPESKELLELAEKYYEEVEHTESEYAERARGHKIDILLSRKPELATGDINALETFDHCVLRAQLEQATMAKEEAAPLSRDPEERKAALAKREIARKKHYANIILALNRALSLVDDKVTSQKIIDARFMLMYYLLLDDDPFRAVVHGEDLAHNHPTSGRAGLAGAYALGGYATILDQETKRDGAESPEATSDRARMKALAGYLETNWKNDVPADEARYQIGVLALREKNFPEALSYLLRVTPAYPMYNRVLFQIASSAQEMARDGKTAPPEGYKSWNDLALLYYAKIPVPRNMKNVEASRPYFRGKISLAYLLFGAKKLDETDKLTTLLLTQFRDLPEALQQEVEPMLAPLPIYARYGKADVLFKSTDPQKYVKVIGLLGPMVKQIGAKQFPDVDQALPRIILFLYLKSCLLSGKIEEAQKGLDMIQGSGGFENQGVVMAQLVKDISDHIKELKGRGKQGVAEYEEAKKNFLAFLDILAKQDLSKLKPEILRFLANSYAAVERFDQSAALLSKILEPAAGATPEEMKKYHFIRLMLAHNYRLGKKFEDCNKVLKELEKTDLPTRSLEYRQEQNYLLEDQEKYNLAATAWKKMYEELKKGRPRNAALAQPSELALFRYIVCLHRFAVQRNKPDFTTRAAKLIVGVEQGDANMGGIKDQYLEFINAEPALKGAYDAAKKAAPVATPAPAAAK